MLGVCIICISVVDQGVLAWWEAIVCDGYQECQLLRSVWQYEEVYHEVGGRDQSFIRVVWKLLHGQ